MALISAWNLGRLGRDRRQRRPGRDGPSLPVRHVPEGDRSLGDHVGEIAPGRDELVELFVHRPEGVSDHGPVQLLADQRQVDELLHRGLQLVSDRLPLMWLCQSRQMTRSCS